MIADDVFRYNDTYKFSTMTVKGFKLQEVKV